MEAEPQAVEVSSTWHTQLKPYMCNQGDSQNSPHEKRNFIQYAVQRLIKAAVVALHEVYLLCAGSASTSVTLYRMDHREWGGHRAGLASGTWATPAS